jgi:hypothetical protein
MHGLRAPQQSIERANHAVRRHNHLLWLALIVCLSALPALAQMVHVDGYTEACFVAASQKVVVFSKSVSGSEAADLLALDAKDGRLLWQKKTERVVGDGLAATDGFLYLTAGDVLQKRTIASGNIVWLQNLAKIPQQKPPPPSRYHVVSQKLLEWIGVKHRAPATVVFTLKPKPSYYTYKLGLSAGKLLVMREAMERSGCMVSKCFNDWLLFDEQSGHFQKGGPGEYVGTAGETKLLVNDDGLFVFRNGRMRTVSGSRLQSASVSPMSTSLESGQYSFGDRCLFQVLGEQGTAMAIFDDRTGRVSQFPEPMTHTNEQSSWVLLGSNMIRYAQCERIWLDEHRSKGQPWFESYDFKGNLKKATEIRFATPRDDYWVSFEGWGDGGTLFKVDNWIYQLEPVGLRLVRVSSPVPTVTPKGTWNSTRRLGSRTYQIDGNIMIEQMNSNTRPHDLVFTALDEPGQRIVWRHVEKVLIQKSSGKTE